MTLFANLVFNSLICEFHIEILFVKILRNMLVITRQNRNREGSGRPRSSESARNIQAVHQSIAQNPRISARRNPLPHISRSTFNRIIRKDLQMYPLRNQRRHALIRGDKACRLNFSNWFVCRGQPFLRYVIIGNEAAFSFKWSGEHMECSQLW